MDKIETAKVERDSGGKFAKGSAKPAGSGRKKGTPNKRTAEFKEILGDFNTVLEMKKLFYETEKEDLKLAICKEFLKYEYPQRKAIDFDTENNGDFVLTINRKAVKAESDGNNV